MPFDKLSKPYTECYVFDDPVHVYDLIAWDSENKLYHLKGDDGRKRFLRYFEFCPISGADQELIEAGDDGKIYTVQQLVDAAGHLAWKRPSWASDAAGEALPSPPAPLVQAIRPEARVTPPKPKDRPANAQGEPCPYREQVRLLLDGATTREEIARRASETLSETQSELVAKYAHLDNGRFRMTIGNRLVGVFKKTQA